MVSQAPRGYRALRMGLAWTEMLCEYKIHTTIAKAEHK